MSLAPTLISVVSMRTGAVLFSLALLAAGLSGCGPKPPLKIGFIGGLSGKFSDLGTANRNGALLAVETANEAGGVGGRKLLLIEQDDQQNNAQALAAMDELKKQAVVAIIGPATSSIAVAITPMATDHQLLLIAPTATTNKLSGKDDYFLRSVGDAAFYGRTTAQFHYSKQGVRTVALALDMANADYTESWGDPYAAEFIRLGGKVVRMERFKSTDQPDHAAIARNLLADNPEMILTVASSVDCALIAQRAKIMNPRVRMAGSAWASTERLIELGGAAVEGLLVEQYFDRFDPSPKFQGFLQAYRSRFKAEPGFGAVLAFDATNMLIAGLQKAQRPDELKSALLGLGNFDGVQGPVFLDTMGDARREVHFGVVKNGAFARIE